MGREFQEDIGLDDETDFLETVAMEQETLRNAIEAEDATNRAMIRSFFMMNENGDKVAELITKFACEIDKVGFSNEPLEMARACGKREVGFWLKKILEEK